MSSRWNTFQRFPFLRFTVFFILGIVARHYLGPKVQMPWICFGVITALFLFFYFWDSKRFQAVLLVISGVLLFSLGAQRLSIHKQDVEYQYLMEHHAKVEAYKGIIISTPEEKENSYRSILSVYEILVNGSWLKVKGRVNVYFDKNEGKELDYGNLLWVNGQFDKTEGPANPGAFDYRNYLVYQNIHFQDFIGDDYLKIGETKGNPIVYSAQKVRKEAVRTLHDFLPDDEVRSIVLALVLGVKDELENDLIAAFSATGAMHVLAVSGLHVGIIYGLLLLIFSSTGLQQSRFRWLVFAVSVGVLWAYAFITGLSPSVLRAVTMFTFVAASRAIKRKGNIYNTLSASALCLLLYDPYLIMSVGFQLSFLAVFGIVYLFPKLYALWSTKHWILDKVWTITCVSIAAQLSTAPLSMLYFHQFPNYFLVSNLFIIPAAFAILVGGLAILLTSWWSFVAQIIAFLLLYFTKAIVFLVKSVSEMTFSTTPDIYLSTFDTWCIYLLLLSFIFGWVDRKMSYFHFALFCALLFASSQILHRKPYMNSSEFSVLAVNGHSVLDFRYGQEAWLWADSAFLKDVDQQRFHLYPKRLLSGSASTSYSEPLSAPNLSLSFGRLALFEGKSILHITKPIPNNFQPLEPIPLDYVVLSKSAGIEPKRITSCFAAQHIILDGAMGYRSRTRFNEAAALGGFEIHDVGGEGYFSKKWRR